jgi:hypothetical protein
MTSDYTMTIPGAAVTAADLVAERWADASRPVRRGPA